MIAPVLSMDEVRTADVRVVGNKASQLARIASRGHAVPSFFVIASDVFAAIRADPRVRALERRLGSDGADDSLLAELRALVAVAEIGTDTWTRIKAACRALGSPVAVRSSGVAEDGARASLAGQLDTVLGVCDDAGLGRAIRVVWSSTYTPRAIAYRRLRGLSAADLGLAVIVQVQIPADVSGVLFTVDPTDEAMLAIAATRGLAPDLVAGRIGGDAYRVHRSTLAIERTSRESAALSEGEVARLAMLGLRLEEELGAPQDIEWAIADGRIAVLQARPITVRAAPRPRRTLWDNSNIIESFPGITLPLTYSVARESYAAVYRQAAALAGISGRDLEAHRADLERMIGLIRGRVYYRLDSWYAVLSLLPGFSSNRRFMEQMMGVREPAANEPPRSRRAPFDAMRLLILLLRMTLLALTLGPRIRAFERMVDDACGRAEIDDLRAQTMSELVDRYDDLKDRIRRRWQAPILNDFVTMLFFGLARLLIVRWQVDATGAVAGELLRGSDMPSIEPARRLEAIARAVRGDPHLEDFVRTRSDAELVALLASGRMPQALADPIRSYLDRYGYRCVQELKLEQPSLRDDPLPLFAGVRSYIARPDVDLGRSAERDRTVRSAAHERLRARLDGPFGLPSPRRLILDWIIGRARRHVRDREQMRFARARVFGLARELFTGIGRRLAEAGRLDDARDVFYLTADEACGVIREVATTADLRELVVRRKSEYRAYLEEPPPPDRFETVDDDPSGEPGRLISATTNAPADGLLTGVPCCAGIVRGGTRLVTSARDGTLRAGEILVARETDPGWITVFPLASGILIERGSALSHSAIVARELGVPTIVGIRGLTAALSTGEVVEMDGGTGRIARIE